MKRQHGQTLIEFALIAPLMFLLIFGMIYGGVMFVDYLNFNNEARTLARKIAVADSSKRDELMKDYPAVDGKSFKRFYTVKMKADYSYAASDTNKKKPIDAVVVVTFERNNKDLPNIVRASGFPPERFAIKYSMKLEDHG